MDESASELQTGEKVQNTNMASKNITIIGAGIAGAATAQLLQRAMKPTASHLFERKQKPPSNFYEISMYPFACNAFMHAISFYSPAEDGTHSLVPGVKRGSATRQEALGLCILRSKQENALRLG